MTKVIAIDQDQVLAEMIDRWVEMYNNDYNDNLTSASFATWDVHGFVKPECGMKIYDYLNREDLYSSLIPVKYSIEIVKELNDKFNVFIVTAATRYPNSLKAKYTWLRENFPFIDKQKIVLCGDKSIIKADYLIDDGIHNLEVFSGEGLLFTAPHNLEETRFQRVNNWLEVADILLKEL